MPISAFERQSMPIKDSHPPSLNGINVHPAMNDFQTAQWVERVVRGQLLSLIGMPPGVDGSEPGPAMELLRALRGRFPVKLFATLKDTPANQLP
jgi:hypothetical protein